MAGGSALLDQTLLDRPHIGEVIPGSAITRASAPTSAEHADASPTPSQTRHVGEGLTRCATRQQALDTRGDDLAGRQERRRDCTSAGGSCKPTSADTVSSVSKWSDVRRALSEVPQRRRCQACGTRMMTKTYGPDSTSRPTATYCYLDGIPGEVSRRRLRRVDYVCEVCEERNSMARADVFRRLDRRLAATVRRYTLWLDQAPSLPQPFQDLPPHLVRFYEAYEIAAAAEAIARDLRHRERDLMGMVEERPRPGTLKLNGDHPLAPFSPNRAPGSYEDVCAKYVIDDGQPTVFTGSVSHMGVGRIAVHWHTERTVSFG